MKNWRIEGVSAQPFRDITSIDAPVKEFIFDWRADIIEGSAKLPQM